MIVTGVIRDRYAPVDADADVLFEISITKPFTGVLLSEMAERGEVRLDDGAGGSATRRAAPASIRAAGACSRGAD